MAALPFALVCLLAVLVTTSLAILEKQIVTFHPQAGAVPIHNAAILYDTQDPVAVEIATESLANDIENIREEDLVALL
jgi:hypothetical protein